MKGWQRVVGAVVAVGLLTGMSCEQLPVHRAGEVFNCKGEERITRDCSSEVDYQGISANAEVNIASIGGAKGNYEDKALRRVSEQIQQFVILHKRACQDFNACIGTEQDYVAKSEKIARVPVLMQAVKGAKTDAEREKALDVLYRDMVPTEQRPEEISFQMGMSAALPPELGGDHFIVAPGDPLPTDGRVHFMLSASKRSYLYIFQTTPSGEVNVLFPDPRIGTRNPLAATTPVRIPGGDQAFRVNDKDLGIEKVYVVVSVNPVDDLDAALGRVKSGEVTQVAQDSFLQGITSVLPRTQAGDCKTRALELDESAPAKRACTRPRGLDLVGTPDANPSSRASNQRPVSIASRTTAGDDMIVQVFHFDHVTKAEFKTRPKPGGITRGGAIEQ